MSPSVSENFRSGNLLQKSAQIRSSMVNIVMIGAAAITAFGGASAVSWGGYATTTQDGSTSPCPLRRRP